MLRTRLTALVAALSRLGAVLACTALAGLIGLITLQVVLRRVFNAPILLTDDVAAFLLAVMTVLGLSYAMARGDHIQVSIVVDRLPAAVLRWLRVLWCLIGLAFTALLTVRTVVLVMESLRTGTFAIISEIPLASVQVFLPVGFALLFLLLLVQLIDALRPPP